MSATLLPPNATPVERAIDRALSRADHIEVPIRTLWNAQACPEHLLPWLAWAWSVDAWDADWTEQQKRNAIDASVFIHRHKGTPAAVQRAVDVVFSDAEVQEWFDYGGEPFHFRVVSQGAFASERDYRRLIRLIESAQNARSWLDSIVIRSRISLEITLATVTAQGNRLHMGPRPATPASDPATVRLGGAAHTSASARISPWQLRLTLDDSAITWRTAYHQHRHMTIRG